MNGVVQGKVRQILRLEALLVLAVSLLLYRRFGAGWGTFAMCFFLPDVALLVYLAGPRVGAVAYNLTHSYAGPLLSLAVSLFQPEWPWAVGLIWCAHIGFDRALGYGLKYAAGFGHTHLGLLGPMKPGASSPSSSAGEVPGLGGR